MSSIWIVRGKTGANPSFPDLLQTGQVWRREEYDERKGAEQSDAHQNQSFDHCHVDVSSYNSVLCVFSCWGWGRNRRHEILLNTKADDLCLVVTSTFNSNTCGNPFVSNTHWTQSKSTDTNQIGKNVSAINIWLTTKLVRLADLLSHRPQGHRDATQRSPSLNCQPLSPWQPPWSSTGGGYVDLLVKSVSDRVSFTLSPSISNLYLIESSYRFVTICTSPLSFFRHFCSRALCIFYIHIFYMTITDWIYQNNLQNTP